LGTTSPLNRLQVSGGSIGIDFEYMIRDNRDNTILSQSASTAASNRSLTIGNATYSNIIVPNGNVGIGTTSPAYKLDVSTNDTSIQTTIGFRNIVISTPSATKSMATYGAQFETTIAGANSNGNALAFQAQIRVTGTNTNNVAKGFLGRVSTSGAGNAATAAGGQFFLEHESSGVITNAYGLQVLNLTNLGSITNTYGVYVGDITVGTQTNTPFSFYAADSNAHNYFAGNVGIGITSPVAKLDIYDATSSNFYLRTGGAGANWITSTGNSQIGTYTNTPFVLKSNDTARIQIQADGNVGIGTTSPDYKLQVSGTIAPEGNEVNNLGSSTNRFNQLFTKLIYDINNGRGLTNQVLTSTGSSGIAWADASTVIGGPYLPLVGGTLTGDVTINKTTPILTFNSSNVNVDQGIVFSNGGTFDASIKHGASTADMVFDIGRNTTWGGAANFKLDTYQTYYMTRNSHAFKILGVNALTIDSSKDATFAGTIDSGAITSTGIVTGTTFTTSAATGWLVKNSSRTYDGTDTVIQNNGVYSIRANGTSVYLRNTYITGLLDVTAGGTFAGTRLQHS
jgi:hypothetical protein